MHFQVSRNGQMYGPYTLQDLERYIASGNVLPTDLAKSEEMTEWMPVSQLLAEHAATLAPATPAAGFSSAPEYSQTYSPVASAGAIHPSHYPDAPNVGWVLYAILTVVTCTLFSKVFTCVQASWLKRVQPNSKALLCYGIQYGILILSIVLAIATYQPYVPGTFPHQSPIVSLLRVLYFVMLFVSRFVMRASLEEHFNGPEPMGLKLDSVMTFFFGGIYFQAELNKLNARKQAARTGAPARS